MMQGLLENDRLEGLVGRWNCIWHEVSTGDRETAHTLLGWTPPGGSTAPKWAISQGQNTANREMRSRWRAGTPNPWWGHYYPIRS